MNVDIHTFDKMSGSKVAALLNVSTNTVSEWTERGMPVVVRGRRGKAHEYRFSDCLRWVVAHDRLRNRRQLDLATLSMVLLGDALMAGDGERRNLREWIPWGLGIAKRLGFAEHQFDSALGDLLESGLLDGAWRP